MYRKKADCIVCTNCGKCGKTPQVNIISSFSATGYKQKEGLGREQPQVFFGYDDTDGKADKLVVVDIGTTTIAMQLRRRDGAILDTYTCMNPQRMYGADILSRIEAAEDETVKIHMMEQVQDVIKQGLGQFSHADKMVIAGNTTMIHLLMGYDTKGLGKAPFTSLCLDKIETRMYDIETLILPGVSAFIGGDITAGVYALSMEKSEAIQLFIDLGTNGEIVLGNKDKLLATATAAGPAFEGNMESFGTDLMNLTAKLLELDILDETGLLKDPYFEQGITIGGVRITKEYVRQLQLAKAAIRTGIEILINKYGLKDCREIEKVYLAGGMGYYLNPHAAIAIGLIPKALDGKIVAVGNAALEGAFIFDFCRGERLTQIQDFNLATESEFEEKYIDNINFISR